MNRIELDAPALYYIYIPMTVALKPLSEVALF